MEASRKRPGGKGWLIFENIIKVRLVGDLCCDGERFSFVFFYVTTPISLFRWETVQPVEMGKGLSFSMQHRRVPFLMGNDEVCWDGGARFSLVYDFRKYHKS